MTVEKIYLKEHYPELGVNDCNPSVTCYIPFTITEMGPEMAQKKWPAIVVCPGGGYCMVSQREAEPIALQFVPEGYRAFVIDYSVAPNGFPCQLLEVAAVMELIYKNAQEWHIDTEDITIIGFSAGGHLAAQYTNRYNCPEVRAVFPESKPVNASILSYGVLSAKPEYTHGDTVRNFVGHVPEVENEKGCDCSMGVTENTPPTFLWHTAADQVVPVECSLLYAQELSKYHIPFELHIYPYGPHGLATADEVTYLSADEDMAHAHRWMADAKTWLKMIRNKRNR